MKSDNLKNQAYWRGYRIRKSFYNRKPLFVKHEKLKRARKRRNRRKADRSKTSKKESTSKEVSK